MKLFTVGPVEMSEEVRLSGAEKIPYFRTAEFSAQMLEIEQMFISLVKAPADAKLITLTASGTGAMEAAVENMLTGQDKVLVINGGSFGARFVELCQRFEVPFEALNLEFGETLTKERLYAYDGQGFTALLVNLHETSVGQLYDGAMLGEFCRKNKMLYIVDGISTVFADPFEMDVWGIDALICSSQKAMALPPGLSFIVVNAKARERIAKAHVKSMYFDLKDYLKNMERGQTPFTPAVGIIMQLYACLKTMCDKGIDAIVAEHAQRAEYFRKLCVENGIKVADFPKSNALTTIEFPENNAYAVFLELKDKHGIMLTPNGGALANRVLRVGHLGALTNADYDEVICLLKEVMQ